jgi:hypothetical protein
MNTRVDIQITIVGEKHSGRDTFSKMLFLNNDTKIKIEPISLLGEVYLEIDPENFKISSEKITQECLQQKSIIMGQKNLKSVKDLRDKDIKPIFYKTTHRIKDFIDPNSTERVNKNVLLSFYCFGDNYIAFDEEIKSSNVIIYITDETYDPTDSKLLQYIFDIVKNSETPKYILPIINKIDNTTHQNKSAICSLISKFDNHIEKHKQFKHEKSNIMSPICLSSNISYILRKIIINNDPLTSEERKILTDNDSKKEKLVIPKDIIKDKEKYLKESGYLLFRKTLINLLYMEHKHMIGYNILNFISDIKNKYMDNCELFIKYINSVKSKNDKYNAIFKHSYESNIVELLKSFFEKDTSNRFIDLDMYDQITCIFKDPSIRKTINVYKNKANQTNIDIKMQELYKPMTTLDDILPTKIFDIYNKILQTRIPGEKTIEIKKHIINIYTNQIIDIISNTQINIVAHQHILYRIFWDKKEVEKLIKMLSDGSSYTEYSESLIKIWIAKIRSAIILLYNNSDKQHELIAYLYAIKHMINGRNIDNKIYNIAINICDNFLAKHNFDYDHQLSYLSNNVLLFDKTNDNGIFDLDNHIFSHNMRSIQFNNMSDDDDSDINMKQYFTRESSSEDEHINKSKKKNKLISTSDTESDNNVFGIINHQEPKIERRLINEFDDELSSSSHKKSQKSYKKKPKSTEI